MAREQGWVLGLSAMGLEVPCGPGRVGGWPLRGPGMPWAGDKGWRQVGPFTGSLQRD